MSAAPHIAVAGLLEGTRGAGEGTGGRLDRGAEGARSLKLPMRASRTADRRPTSGSARAVTRLAPTSLPLRPQDGVRPNTYAAEGPALTVRFLLDSDI